jgi:hypothetical protein
MSRYMGCRVAGNPPPHIKKHKTGEPRMRFNKYGNLKPSEQKNTSGQRRVRRALQNAPSSDESEQT